MFLLFLSFFPPPPLREYACIVGHASHFFIGMRWRSATPDSECMVARRGLYPSEPKALWFFGIRDTMCALHLRTPRCWVYVVVIVFLNGRMRKNV